MPKYLVIVESPAKAKTISKYLGKNYTIKASYGHIRDLPGYRLGVNISENFSPFYSVLKDKTKILKELNKIASKAEIVYIATDPDREGEAIAWHIQESLDIDNKKVKRIVFHEITKKAVTEAINLNRNINLDLVNAQQARRVLDRLIGYKLSPILSKKIQRGLSAGRVQSVAVKIICDREQEIDAFESKEFWNIDAKLANKDKKTITVRLSTKNKETKKLAITSKTDADKIINDLKSSSFSITNIKTKKVLKKPSAPFITSTLQQEASRKFNWTTKKTMYVAQQLYEGIEIDGESVGLITYMRTDSFRIADEAQESAKSLIKEIFGKEYIPEKSHQFKQKKNAQDAHEAIRPSYIEKTPALLKDQLTGDPLKLYKLVWDRFMASQMSAAIVENTSIEITAASKTSENYLLKTQGNVIIFNGFYKLYKETKEDSDEQENTTTLPVLSKNEQLDLEDVNGEQKFTQPPPRYTESSLIRELEEKGIGRPSTYAPTISTIQDRLYVTKTKKTLSPSDLGTLVNKNLNDFFSKFIDTAFTASMETRLDEIIDGKHEWQDVVKHFYDPFAEKLEIANEKMVKINNDIPTDKICEKCQSPMVIKKGRFGEFLACTNFPTCKNTKSLAASLEVNCPDCKSPLVEKRSRKGKVFYGCSGYPNCKFALWDRPIPEKCPKCKSAFMLIKTLKNKKEIKYCKSCEDENKSDT
jgi:DNA topoisomerase I